MGGCFSYRTSSFDRIFFGAHVDELEHNDRNKRAGGKERVADLVVLHECEGERVHREGQGAPSAGDRVGDWEGDLAAVAAVDLRGHARRVIVRSAHGRAEHEEHDILRGSAGDKIKQTADHHPCAEDHRRRLDTEALVQPAPDIAAHCAANGGNRHDSERGALRITAAEQHRNELADEANNDQALQGKSDTGGPDGLVLQDLCSRPAGMESGILSSILVRVIIREATDLLRVIVNGKGRDTCRDEETAPNRERALHAAKLRREKREERNGGRRGDVKPHRRPAHGKPLLLGEPIGNKHRSANELEHVRHADNDDQQHRVEQIIARLTPSNYENTAGDKGNDLDFFVPCFAATRPIQMETNSAMSPAGVERAVSAATLKPRSAAIPGTTAFSALLAMES